MNSVASTRNHVVTLIGARVVSALLSAVTGLLVPHALTRSDYGHYGIAIGIAGVLVVLSDLGLTTASARYLAEGRPDGALLGRVALLRFGAAAITGAGLAIVGFVFALNDSGSIAPAYLILSGVLVFTSSILGVAMGLLPTLRRMRGLLALTIAQPALELAGMLVAIGLGWGAEGIIVASATAALVTGSVGIVFVVRALRTGDRVAEDARTSLGTLVRYSRAMFIVAICFTLFGQVDQLVVYAFHGADVAAGYIASWRLVILLHLPGLAAATVVAPRLAGGGAACRSLFARWLGMLLVLYAGMIAVAAALAPALVPLALGEQYRSSASLFVGLSLYAVLLGVAPHVTMAANFLGGAQRRVRLGIVTVAVNLAIDLALVPPFGVWGAVIGTTVAFGWYVAAHAALTWRLLDGDLRRDLRAARGNGVLTAAIGALAGALLAGTTARLLVNAALPHAPDVVAVVGSGLVALALYSGLIVGGWRLLPRAPGAGSMGSTSPGDQSNSADNADADKAAGDASTHARPGGEEVA